MAFDVRISKEVPIIKKIYDLLYYNVNNWQRAEASRGGEKEHDRHFYEIIFSRENLTELSKITGFEYPNWGECSTDVLPRMGITPHSQYWYGRSPDGRYAPIGLRWAKDMDEWRGIEENSRRPSNKGTGKNFRTNAGYVFRPQVVVTLRPTDIYVRLRKDDRWMTTGGRTADGEARRRFKARVIESPLWKRARVVPLCVVLPISGFDPDMQHAFEPAKNSRFENSHADLDTEPDQDFLKAVLREAAFAWKGGDWR